MQLPDSFIKTFTSAFKKDGEAFLAVLPSLIDEVSARWGLTNVQPVPNLSFNFVAFAKRDDEDVILKMGIPNPELTSEMTTLKLFNGDGACQLLKHDEERGFLLLERLKPGKMLAELEDDDERTNIAADVMLNIQSRGGVTPPLRYIKFCITSAAICVRSSSFSISASIVPGVSLSNRRKPRFSSQSIN